MRNERLIEFGELIRKVRESKNISLEQISKEINVDEYVISEIENGRLDDVSIRLKISNCLGVGITDNSKIVSSMEDF